MRTCPSCGNHWDTADKDNRPEAEAGGRDPIILVEHVRSEMDESVLKMRCTACSEVWTGRYKGEKLLGVERYHKGKHKLSKS